MAMVGASPSARCIDMARPLKRFVCQSCGAVTTKWSGRCESCGEWNTITEESAPAPGPAGGGLARAGKGRTLDFAGLTGQAPQPPRYKSGIVEFDRVCGGGLVVGSALLIGGDRGIAVLLVGHVTKDGAIAGPRVLEHMVDTVLYFEGERGHQFRILRTVKNRFGPTDEIGVFEMSDRGLKDVANPSALFLAERRGHVSGACVFAGIEGTRPVLVEIQALVGPSSLATPRRAVVGWDSNRLAMVLAVLEARCGVSIGASDVYLNVAGGLRIGEPAADLAVAAAVVSSLANEPVPADMAVFGEIGLGGEVRPVGQREARLREAAKLGFRSALVPRARAGAGASPRPPEG